MLEENPVKNEHAEDEINLLDYLKVILKRIKMIIAIVVIIVTATAIMSLLQTKIYESKAIIASASTRTDTGAGMGAVVAQFGLGTPVSSSSIELENVLKSNILKNRIVKKYNLLPFLLKPDALKKKTEDEKTWAGIKALEKILVIKYNMKENVVAISAQCSDPKMAANLVSYTLQELNELMTGEAKRVADTNKNYLESQIDKTLDPFIRTKIYSMIAQQVETSVMSEVKENFAFKIIDPPMVPVDRIKPKRTRMVMIAFVGSLFIGILVAFFKEYIDKLVLKEKESTEGAR